MKKYYIIATIAAVIVLLTNPIIINGINLLLDGASEYSDYTMLIGVTVIIGCFYFASKPKKKK